MKIRTPVSNVTLYIPKSVNATVITHIHTNTLPFHEVIPENECFIAPIPEITIIPRHDKVGKDRGSIWYQLRIPHCVRDSSKLNSIRVRHGNIHSNKTFSLVPALQKYGAHNFTLNCYYEVDSSYVTIHTRTFSQFVCTSCERICHGNAKAFLFGSLRPYGSLSMVTALRLYVCSPLYNIKDYRMVS